MDSLSNITRHIVNAITVLHRYLSFFKNSLQNSVGSNNLRENHLNDIRHDNKLHSQNTLCEIKFVNRAINIIIKLHYFWLMALNISVYKDGKKVEKRNC